MMSFLSFSYEMLSTSLQVLSCGKLDKVYKDILASKRQNLSSGFPIERDSNQSPQLQTLARKLKLSLLQAET